MNPARTHAKVLTVPSRNGSGALRASLGGPDEMLSRRTELVLKELDELPTLPSVASRILSLASAEEVQIKEIVRVIESDPSLTTRLLALCRRAAYRTRHPITTVEMAVVMLGVEAVRSLVLSVEIFDWTTRSTDAYRREGSVSGATGKGRASTRPGSTPAPAADPKPAFNRIGFWQHSIAVACAADLIAREHPDLDLHPEECFVCGLIHDMGKVALDLVLPRAYARVIELVESRQGDIADFERPIVGVDHLLAGRTLAQRWGLPTLLVQAMGMHNIPPAELADSPYKRTLSVVHIADLMCRKLAMGWSGNLITSGDERDLCRQAGLNPERTLSVIPKLYESTSARMRDLGLGDEPSQQMLVESILRANQRLGRVNQDLVEVNYKLEQAQKELTEARAMARLGQMTAGAAHEMNNPLTIISGRAQSLLPKLKDETDRAAARAIIDASGKLTNLITRLNRCATPPDVHQDIVDVREFLEEVIKSAKDRHGERQQQRGERLSVMGVKLTIAEGIELARIDPAVISDALIEIIINALEGGPRGRVEVSVSTEPLEDHLVFAVMDDGIGMSEKALAHATDPFFSEKAAGRQAGLGLALAHRLIAAHGGEIELASKPGRGTTATVRIPDWRTGAETRGASPSARSRSAA
jgi:signal transduction histidine kinase